jgi:hypothetical protein
MAYTKYSLTPADNNAAPPNGAPEGMLPSGVNDTMRDMMSQIRDVGDGIRGGTYTMTAPVITGGSINDTIIGATTATTATFTTATVNRVADSQGGSVAPISSVMRNRIINGAMVIDQRNAGAAVVATGTNNFPVDRYNIGYIQTNKFTAQRNAGSVTPPVGFTNYLGITSSSAYSVLTGDAFLIDQRIEGFNFADMAWGTASAATVTLSFWVRSSLTGTFGGCLSNAAVNRSYPFSYTISAANTWEQKSVTIAGDTTGTWVGATNGIGVIVRFGLGSGATFSGTAGAWQAGNLVQPTGTVSVVGTNGATWYITGLQLEKGTQATSFEYRQYQQELALCQRYYSKSYNTSVVPATAGNDGAVSTSSTATAAGGVITSFGFPVEMRASPTMTFYSSVTGDSGVWHDAGSATNKTVATYTAAGTRGAAVYNTAAWSAVGTGAYGHWVASIEI